MKMTEEELEERQTGELLVQVAEENQTRKILMIMNECQDLEEAKTRIKQLIKE